MAYCVNCGVKLQEGTTYCPLCQIDSHNPLEKKTEEVLLYPQTPLGHREKPKSRASLLLVISLFLSIPVFITIISDLMTDGRLSWSAYVVASMALLYVIAVLPFFFEKNKPILFLAIDFCAVLLFLFVVNTIGSQHWFFPFAFVLTVGIGILIVLLTLLLGKAHLSKTAKTASVFLFIGLCTVHVELSLCFCFEAIPLYGWSLYSILGCLAFAVIAIIIDNSPILKEELKKRMFF